MRELKKNGIYHIKVRNISSKTNWEHKRVPSADVHCLRLNKNLKVEVVRMVGVDDSIRENSKR